MLIVDMPMPKNCTDCDICNVHVDNPYCRRLLKRIPQNGRLENCHIKGELVRCGECECGEPDEEPQNDGKKYVWCKHWRAWRPEDGFCDMGKEKMTEAETEKEEGEHNEH